jgi:hypothetical protein
MPPSVARQPLPNLPSQAITEPCLKLDACVFSVQCCTIGTQRSTPLETKPLLRLAFAKGHKLSALCVLRPLTRKPWFITSNKGRIGKPRVPIIVRGSGRVANNPPDTMGNMIGRGHPPASGQWNVVPRKSPWIQGTGFHKFLGAAGRYSLSNSSGARQA